MQGGDQDVDTGRPRPVEEIADRVLEILNGTGGLSNKSLHAWVWTSQQRRVWEKRDMLAVSANRENHGAGSRAERASWLCHFLALRLRVHYSTSLCLCFVILKKGGRLIMVLPSQVVVMIE